MAPLIAVLRAWQIPTAALFVAVVLVLGLIAGDERTSIPGVRSVIALVSFAPFGLSAAVGGVWRTTYHSFERAGVRRPWSLRACRAGAACLLALGSAWLMAQQPGAPAELVVLTLVCLAGGLLTACVAPPLWWVLPLCLNYSYYAGRVSVATAPAALPVAWALLLLAGICFALASPGARRGTA